MFSEIAQDQTITDLSASVLRSRRLPPDVPQVYTFEEAWIQLLNPETTGVILHRDPHDFAGISADLRQCTLIEWGRTKAERFVGSDEGELRTFINEELVRIGIKPEFSKTLALITEDMIRINKFVEAMTGEPDIRSYVGSMWRDKRGYHIDTGDNIGAFVTYIGPGCLVVGKDEVFIDPSDPVQMKKPIDLVLKPGVTPYLTSTFDVVFLKGRADLTKASYLNNAGLPHSSPNPFDAENGFDKRISYIAYGTTFGERFAAPPDFAKIRKII